MIYASLPSIMHGSIFCSVNLSGISSALKPHVGVTLEAGVPRDCPWSIFNLQASNPILDQQSLHVWLDLGINLIECEIFTSSLDDLAAYCVLMLLLLGYKRGHLTVDFVQ